MREPTAVAQPPLAQLNPGVSHQAQEPLPKRRLRLASNPKVLPTENIIFWSRNRLVHAAAVKVEKELPNVLLLQVVPSILDQLIGMAFALLPSLLRTRLDKFFPEWNLPSRLALKTCKKGWDEEFEQEKSTYKEIKSLQGIRIPKYYGELEYNGVRALLLLDIGGACMGDPAGALLDMEEFRRLMNQALTDLAQFSVLPDDIRLENFHLVNNKVMVVDFEMVRKYNSVEESTGDVEGLTNWLATMYQGRQHDFNEIDCF